MKKSELLPCPNCGEQPYMCLRERRGKSWVYCMVCGYNTGDKATPAEATETWNRRAPGWMPIESAPKDRAIILTTHPNAPHLPDLHVGFWDAQADEWDTGTMFKLTPTHWMPLPAAPEAQP